MNSFESDMNPSSLRWYSCERAAALETISKAEKEMNIQLPRLYKDLMQICDAGSPLKTDFEYYDVFYKRKIFDALGYFLGVEHGTYNIVDTFKSPPEFFSSNIVAFAETGGGDYICFDYRMNRETLNPPIVFWNHEADSGSDISFIAKDLEEFMKMLKPPSDE